jgi:hypothetical protein
VIELHSLSVRGVWRPKEDTLTATVVSNDYACIVMPDWTPWADEYGLYMTGRKLSSSEVVRRLEPGDRVLLTVDSAPERSDLLPEEASVIDRVKWRAKQGTVASNLEVIGNDFLDIREGKTVRGIGVEKTWEFYRINAPESHCGILGISMLSSPYFSHVESIRFGRRHFNRDGRSHSLTGQARPGQYWIEGKRVKGLRRAPGVDPTTGGFCRHEQSYKCVFYDRNGDRNTRGYRP